jgi:predicted RNase H-like nuclease
MDLNSGQSSCLSFPSARIINRNHHNCFCEYLMAKQNKLGVMAQAFNPSTREAEAGEFLSSRPAWSTEWVPGQPGLHRETLSGKANKNKNKPKQTNKQKTPTTTQKKQNKNNKTTPLVCVYITFSSSSSSCSLAWFQIRQAAEDGLEFLIFLPLPAGS